MRTRFFNLWYRLTSSFWFIPAVLTAAAMALASVAERIDRAVGDANADIIYGGNPEGARSLLSTIAGSVMTVTGVVFSITIAALTLASQQFGPRLLRQFMRDKGNQVVLGIFVGTFVYCLLILRLVRGGDDPFVPGISISIALALALLSLAVLIYFIHHVASMIQADSVIDDVGRELERAVKRVFPKEIGEGAPEPELSHEDRRIADRIDAEGLGVDATDHGYLEAVDNEGLMALACQHDLVISLAVHPGDYVVTGLRLATVWPPDAASDPAVCQSLNKALLLGSSRTMEQDMDFGIDQLVEIASRALSPGINDPFTAESAVNRLSSMMVLFMRREAPSPHRLDASGRLRVIAPAVRFDDVIDGSFDRIREYGAKHLMVLNRLLEVLSVLANEARTDEQRAAILRHASLVLSARRDNFHEPRDLRGLEERYQGVVRRVEQPEAVA